MGHIRPPKRAKLFAGLLVGDVDLLALAKRRLKEHFGPIDQESDIWDFNSTDYYEPELGPDVKRQFVFFDELTSIERLPEIKRLTNDIELAVCDQLALPHATRPVNIDPGYLTLSKLVLATTKDHAHRVYVARGIYAEVTLNYEHSQWRSHPWTYPDYAAETYHAAFTTARNRLKEQLSQTGVSDRPRGS
jgi:hypothetical protein